MSPPPISSAAATSADSQPSRAAPSLDELLGRGDLWQARAGRRRAVQRHEATGHAALDRVLPAGGWPCGGLIECALPHAGCGEIALLAPALQRLGVTGGLQLWVNPPHLPYPPALQQLGLPLPQLVVARPRNAAEWLWCCEQALRSPALGALLCWPLSTRPGDQPGYAQLRKLQVAASAREALLCLFSSQRTAVLPPSPAVLRLLLTPIDAGLQVEILKVRGSAGGQVVRIPLWRSATRRPAQRAQARLVSQPLQAWRQLDSRLAPPQDQRVAGVLDPTPLPAWKPS